ncbi:3'-5' exonuclease [Variovorax sp. HJSM1_2]|uniref:3'-5' exonuclease n=1 Tax=Variovorax sp. HJSM1_2 TaxID=3366263 RepID=UPI003BBA9A33
MKERKEAPTREQMALLPAFPVLGPQQVWLVDTPEQAQLALPELLAQPVLGFDTESKPTFLKEQKSDGPHVVQFATTTRAYVFQLWAPECRLAVTQVLGAAHVVKAGFGLVSDLRQIAAKFGAAPQAVLDVDALFRQQGYRRELGVKAAVAVVFGQRFNKSKKASTSNWAARKLSTVQVLYAANDAYAAMQVYAALQRENLLHDPRQ